ncbi:MAG: type II toxin-antitoxin system RelE/ParE family toxin [Pseudomonadota bacterium]
MVKEVRYRRAALAAFRRMSPAMARRIVDRVARYAADPAGVGHNVKALKGEEALPLRVGDYRVIFLEDDVIDVVRIGHRSDVYR